MADDGTATEPALDGAAGPDGEPPTEAEKAAVRVAAVDVHPPTRLERGSYRSIRGLFLGLARGYFRLDVRGREHLPASGPYVVAPVHRSNLDFVLVSTIRPQRMRYMGKASIWKYPTLGKFFSMLGAFPVHRGTADRESLRTCMRIIENGEPLVMFPEGTRREGTVVREPVRRPRLRGRPHRRADRAHRHRRVVGRDAARRPVRQAAQDRDDHRRPDRPARGRRHRPGQAPGGAGADRAAAGRPAGLYDEAPRPWPRLTQRQPPKARAARCEAAERETQATVARTT